MKHIILAALAVAASLGAAQADAPRSIVVMDGSGSMWGQIDGRTKLDIAREVVTGVLAEIPAHQEVGLIAYGHRRKGDCSDIELMVPPAQGTGGDIAAKVNAMKFLGKTPLSEAVRQAAIALRYGEEAATVILVTDGLETCAADPCALGRELEANGLNFTAHVIGFGLTQEEGAQVACLAEETGGRYIQARDARSLKDALAQTVADAPAASPAPAPLPTTELTAPDSAPIGSKVQVGWTGIAAEYDTVEVGAVGGDMFDYSFVSDGNPVTVQMPGTVGPYELRYKNGDHSIIATRPITVTEAPLAINTPDLAVAGQLLPVAWSGPNAAQDNIQLRVPGDGGYIAYEYLTAGNPLVMRMPDQPGDYEFAYKLNDQDVILTRPIKVLPLGSDVPPIPASLQAPEQAEVSSTLRIRWQGPGAASDYVTIRKADSTDLLDFVLIGKGDQVELVMPAEPGDYVLGYLFADETELASLPITIFAAEADQPVDVPPVAVPITLRADSDAADLMVQWSAVPVPGNDLATAMVPEAWAMGEMIAGPVEASFLPGDYDVRGDAGDAVFSGRISVIEGGANSFVIGYDPAQSPAGPDDPPAVAAPQDPVAISINGAFDGMAVQWRATPVSGQDSEPLGTGAFDAEAWQTMLDPGDWLIEGWANGGTGLLYLARLTVQPQQPQTITLARTVAAQSSPLTLPDGAEIVQQCQGDVACYGTSAAGLRMTMLPGWATTAALVYETAAGVAAEQPAMSFYAGAPLQFAAALNPRQWDGQIGPCSEVTLGLLCSAIDADPAGVTALRNTLAPVEPTAKVDVDFEQLEGQEIVLPEGVDLRELLAPGLLKDK